MAKKGHKPEEIVAKLRQADVSVSQGRSFAEAMRAIGATEVTYDELLEGEIFYTLREAEVVIESWRRPYNGVRPHASLGFRPPAPEMVLPPCAAWPAALRRPASPTMQTVASKSALN